MPTHFLKLASDVINKKKVQTERRTCERHGWFPITENGKV